MAQQKTLIILKPDAVARGLAGRILSRFEEKGLRIAGMRLQKIPPTLARRHYREHKGKPFYRGLLRFITSGPVVLLVLEGKNAVAVCRKMLGATFGSDALPGTIRGDFGLSDRLNLVHGSDSPRTARREIALYFRPSELVRYPREELRWNYDLSEGFLR
jgi:nucleoside-diphosphate kinase